jgi:gamma-tubulin complex component 3
LLHELSDSPAAKDGVPPVLSSTIDDDRERAADDAFSNAFSYQGLHRLPGREGLQSRAGGLPGGDLGTQWGPLGLDGEGAAMRTKAEILAEMDSRPGIYFCVLSLWTTILTH